MTNPLLVILGPTAAGKTRLAVNLAHEFNGEIISADSRQVFSGMDIGTGKDLEEYYVSGKKIPYHLIDIKAAGEKYNVDAFKEDFYTAFQQINAQHQLPILCGGTGMYIHSILQQHELTAIPVNEGLRQKLMMLSKELLVEKLQTYPKKLWLHVDFSSAKRMIRAIEICEFLTYQTLPKNERPNIDPLVIGLSISIEIRRKQILDRLALRLKNGLIEEVQGLLAKGIGQEMLTFYGLEYKFVGAYLNKELDFETLKERLGIAICQYAKRQLTFFRKMEKDGVKINWLAAEQGMEELKQQAMELISHKFDLK